MPGFNVNSIGRGAPSTVRPFYSYGWDITSVFGDTVRPEDGGGGMVYARDATLPTILVGREEPMGSSLKYKFASDVTWEDVKITWYDTVGLCNKLKQWRNSVWTPQTGIQLANNYKKDTKLTKFPYDSDGSSSAVTWTMVGSWPAEIREGELTYTTSEIKIVSVTIAYDWAYEDGCGSNGDQILNSTSQNQPRESGPIQDSPEQQGPLPPISPGGNI